METKGLNGSQSVAFRVAIALFFETGIELGTKGQRVRTVI